MSPENLSGVAPKCILVLFLLFDPFSAQDDQGMCVIYVSVEMVISTNLLEYPCLQFLLFTGFFEQRIFLLILV